MPEFLFFHKAESAIKWPLCALHRVMFFFVSFVVRGGDCVHSFVILLTLQTKESRKFCISSTCVLF